MQRSYVYKSMSFDKCIYIWVTQSRYRTFPSPRQVLVYIQDLLPALHDPRGLWIDLYFNIISFLYNFTYFYFMHLKALLRERESWASPAAKGGPWHNKGYEPYQGVSRWSLWYLLNLQNKLAILQSLLWKARKEI